MCVVILCLHQTASPAYSEDFEEECSEKSDEEPQEKVSSVFQKPDGHGMLAKGEQFIKKKICN